MHEKYLTNVQLKKVTILVYACILEEFYNIGCQQQLQIFR